MPGPRNKNTKRRPQASTSSSREVARPAEPFVDGIGGIEGWKDIIDYLCDAFKLPDLSRRSGLKKIHANFSTIYGKLNDAYTRNMGNEKIMGGIVAIWAKMCVDAVLRNRLVREGLVTKIMPLMDMRITRVVGLQALSTITHHGGLEVRVEIAKQTPTLLRLMQEFPDNVRINELIVAVVAHTVGAVINEEHLDHTLVKKLDIPNVLKLTLEAMRKPNASLELVEHAITLITSATRHCHEEIKSLPPMLNLLAACLRVNDISMRCNALASFIRINLAGSEKENRTFDPQMLIRAVERRFPDPLVDAMLDFGANQCETTLLATTANAYQKAMMKVAQDKDLYVLGKTLADLITRTEFSVADGGWQGYNEKTGRVEMFDVGLPFKHWLDGLPHCARALRARNAGPLDLDQADILDLKFYIIRNRIPDAIAHAKKAIERNPNVAYFYYAISLGANHSQALRAIKKGIKARQTTPFVRYYLLWRAVEHAGDMGVTTLADARAGGQEFAEGIAFLMSALDDAEEYFLVAPPDARHMTVIVNWYVVLTLAIRGPALSPELKELEPAFKKLDIARGITEHIGFPYKRTQMRLSREMIVRLYPKAIKDFSATISYYDSLYNTSATEEKNVADADDTLAAWLDDMTLEDGDQEDYHGHRHGRDSHIIHPKMNPNTVELYRCTYCRNPSAILKKCSACGKARYCDAACQKAHWSEHKATCKAS